ncbi:hypothetical protein QR680_016798 [Steinernema hermaphroditum]|uniref:Uncharacterized protein n=1 Tax=Steinernema hermaphroditum TaxID=289476 RepID=A0AA39LMX4_9BILA|nr:hypothetical protein QR680_016798 [Steinernema hermaphroditum]
MFAFICVRLKTSKRKTERNVNICRLALRALKKRSSFAASVSTTHEDKPKTFLMASQKVVIVTGSSCGIGQGIALLLAQQGAAVTIHGRSLEGLKETEKLLINSGINPYKIHVVQGDIVDVETEEKLINETVEKFGQLDVLVNNAGVVAKPGTDPEAEENLDFIFDVNLKSAIRLIKLAIPHLEKTRGNIVNVSSIAAIKPFPGVASYSMSKISLDHYMRIEAPALARKGIRINNLNPGLVHTNIMSRTGYPKEAFEQQANKMITQQIPLGRAGTCLDMAHAVSYLASDEASYVTGTTLVVDGGAVLGNVPELEQH